MNSKDVFIATANKNIFTYSLEEIEKSYIQFIEIELEMGYDKPMTSSFNFQIKNCDNNQIKFIEGSYSKKKISSKLKIQLIILFPKNITENSYIVTGDLNSNLIENNKRFIVCIDVVGTLEEKRKRSGLINNLKESIKNKSIKIKNVQNSFKNIDLYELLFPKKDNTKQNDNEYLIKTLIEDIGKKAIEINDLKKEKEVLLSKLKTSCFNSKFADLKTKCNEHFQIEPIKKNVYNLDTKTDSFTIINNNNKSNCLLQKQLEIIQKDILEIEKKYQDLFDTNKKLKKEYFDNKNKSLNKKKLNKREFCISNQECILNINRSRSEHNFSLFECNNNRNQVKKTEEINQKKSGKLTKTEIENIIQELDSKFMVNANFNKKDIINAIIINEGDMEKIQNFLFV